VKPERPARPILRVGLTGGIASGKTTVARMLAELGAFVLDGDALAHAVIEPGQPAYESVVARFGREILAADGRIDRARLGPIVFGDPRAREALNAIVHPAVLAAAERAIDDYTVKGHSPIAVFDAALLVETGAYRELDRLIVIRCSAEAQMHRLVARDGLAVGQAQARIEAQAPLAQKLAVADYVIDTDGTLRETRQQTEEVYAKLLLDFENEKELRQL
jgi:dephospho-CoA kinase